MSGLVQTGVLHYIYGSDLLRVHLSGKEISLAGFIEVAKKMDCYSRVNSCAVFKVCYSFLVVFSCETLLIICFLGGIKKLHKTSTGCDARRQ